MKKIILIFSALMVLTVISAQEPTNVKPAIIRAIENGNTSPDSKITIIQDSRIESIISNYLNRPEYKETGYEGPGYRVQVFSSNSHKTALNEAIEIERKLRSAFPAHAVYRTFSSPFWKVRIGNFKTVGEARSLRSDIVKAFPNLAKESYTVRENKIKIEEQ